MGTKCVQALQWVHTRYVSAPSWELAPEALSLTVEQTAVPVQMSSSAIFPRPRSPSVTSSSRDAHLWLSTRFLCGPPENMAMVIIPKNEEKLVWLILMLWLLCCLIQGADFVLSTLALNLWVSSWANSYVMVRGQLYDCVQDSGRSVTTSEGRLRFTLTWVHLIYLVGAVLSTLALQVAGEISMFTELYDHHQRPWGVRKVQRGTHNYTLL